MRVETSSLARLSVLNGKQHQKRALPWAGRQRDEEESAFILPASVSLNLTGGSINHSGADGQAASDTSMQPA